MVVEWIKDIGLEGHNVPRVIKYFKDEMIESVSLKDEILSTCKIKTMKYLEGQLRMKCAQS